MKAHGWSEQLPSHRTSLHNVSTCQSPPTTPSLRAERATTVISFNVQLSCRTRVVQTQQGQARSNHPPQLQVFPQHRNLSSQCPHHGSLLQGRATTTTWLSRGCPPTAPTMCATYPSLWRADPSQYSTRISRGPSLNNNNNQPQLRIPPYRSRQTTTHRGFKS